MICLSARTRLQNSICENQYKQDCHNYVDLAVFIHNTSYHYSIGRTSTFLILGRELVTPLDLRFNNKLLQNLETRFTITQNLHDQMNGVSRQLAMPPLRLTTSFAISSIKQLMRPRYINTNSVSSST